MNSESFTSGQKGSFTRLKNEIKEEADGLLDKLKEHEQEISDLRTYLLEDEDEDCLQTELKKAKLEVDEMVDQINDQHSEIEATHKTLHEASIGLFPKIEATKIEIDSIFDETSSARKKFNESYIKLYGEGKEEEGLESRLETLFASYESNLANHKESSEGLIHQIEGALSGATNVELAKAFYDQKLSYGWPKNGWTIVFLLCISSMVYLANDLNTLNNGSIDYGIELLKRLPLFGPLIWLALFSSKQQAQSKRLQEEYAHKESVAKTYVGHKHQIEKLKDGDAKDDLIAKLAASTIEAIEFNPSSTLERQTHKDDLPASELLKLLKATLDKIEVK